MAAPAEENYLSVYKQFLKEFTATINPNDPLPVKVTGYSLDDADLEGEIIDWTLQYLNQKSCPQTLASTIARFVLDEMETVIKEEHDLRTTGDGEKEVHYDPLKLMHAVISRVGEVCERCLLEAESWDIKNGICPRLPPPSPGPPLVSSYAIKNHRRRMEDRHVAIEDLHLLFNLPSTSNVGYFAIFDGHHGHEAAAFSAAQLHGMLVHSKHYPKDPTAALKDAFLRTDETFIKKCASSQKLLSGTTALVALVRHRESLHVAWLGDSLGILVKSGGKIIKLVDPHTAERVDERRRIESEGGVVIMHYNTWRINGTLAISRAIGDPDCKPHVSAVADVVTHPLDGTEHFLILACDGLWDCVTEEQVTNYVYEQLREDPGNHADLSKSLVQLAKSRASNDNISVVVVLLSSVEQILATAPPPQPQPGKEIEEYLQRLLEAEAPRAADGLSLYSRYHQELVNGAMDGEATALFSSSSEFVASSSLKGVPPEEEAPPAEEEEGEEQHRTSDFFPSHNGHSDPMTSSFYGIGGDDARNLFGDPSDLGPETDVDLLDEDPTVPDDTDFVQVTKSEDVLTSQVPTCPEGTRLGFDEMDTNQGPGFGGRFEEWLERKARDEQKEEVFGQERFTPSPRQIEEEGKVPEERVVCSEEETEGRQSEVKEEELEIGGGSGAEEEAYDDSEEEDAEWKYVSGKSGGGIAVPEAVSPGAVSPQPVTPEVVVEAEDSDPAPPFTERNINIPSPVPTFEKQREEIFESSPIEVPDLQQDFEKELKAHTQETDEIKFCQHLGFELVQPVHVEENQCMQSDFLKDQLLEEQQTKEEVVVKSIEEESKVEHLEELDDLDDSTMESRLNPDAAEFVPVSPTRNVAQDSINVGGREFDMFRKEAEACPGEVSDVVSVTPRESIQKEEGVCFSSEITNSPFRGAMDDDSDVVLSSSFSCDMKQPAEMVEKMSCDKEFFPHDSSSFVDEDEDKENMPEDKENMLENKENMLLPEQCSLETSGLQDEGIEVLEERVYGSDVSDTVVSQNVLGMDNSLTAKVEAEPTGMDRVNIGEEVQSEKEVTQVELIQPSVETKTELNLLADISQQSNEINASVPVEEIQNTPMDYLQNESGLTFGFEEVKEHVEEKKQMTLDELQMHEDVLQTEVHDQIQMHVEEMRPAFELNFSEKQEEEKSAIIEASQEFSEETIIEGTQVHEEVKVHSEELSAQIKDSPIDDILANERIDHFDLSHSNNQVEFVQDDQVCPPNVEEIRQQKLFSLEEDECGGDGEHPIRIEESIPTGDLITQDTLSPSEIRSPEPQTLVEHLQEIKIIEDHDLFQMEFPKTQLNLESCPSSDKGIPSPTQVIDMSCNIESEKLTTDVTSKIEEQFSQAAVESEPIAELVQEQMAKTVEPVVADLLCPENASLMEEVQAVEILSPTSEIKETIIEDVVSPQENVDKITSEVKDEAVAVGATTAAAAAVVAGVAAAAATAAAVKPESKPTTKKATPADKKKAPEKSKAMPAAATKPKTTTAKPMVSSSKVSSATAKGPVTSPTKTASTTSARPSTTERKATGPAATKSLASAKTVAAPLSSKPKTSAARPSTAPSTKPTAPKTAPAPRATSAVGTATSKPATSSKTSANPRASAGTAAHPKPGEVKKTVNGDSSKPSTLSSTSTTTSRPIPKKLPLSGSTSTTKPTPSATRTPPTARPSLTSHKTASESSVTKAKASPTTSAVNGTATKPARPSTGSKPTPPLSARTKTSTTTTKTSTMSVGASGDPKKAKESVNKHISETRAAGLSTARRSPNLKANVPASKTASTVGAAKKSMMNGTAIKKPLANGTAKNLENSDSKKEVNEKKEELVMSPHANGLSSETSEVSKEETSDLIEVKEQAMLIVGESVGEAV